MTRWGLRKRLRAWVFDKLVGEMLNDVGDDEPPPEPERPDVEHVEVMRDGDPMLPFEAQQMIATREPEKEAIPAVEAKPLEGSVEERLARLRLR